jgi:hypothetical protein
MPATALRCWLGVLAGFGGVGGCAGLPEEGCFVAQVWVIWFSDTETDRGPPVITRWWGVATDNDGNEHPFDVNCDGDASAGPEVAPQGIFVGCLNSNEWGGGIRLEGAFLSEIRGAVGADGATWATYEYRPVYDFSDPLCPDADFTFRLTNGPTPTDAGAQ